MKLNKVDKTQINSISGYKKSKNMDLIEQFRDSNMDCAEIVDYTAKDGHGCASSINQTLRRTHCKTVKAIVRKGRPYLIKTELMQK